MNSKNHSDSKDPDKVKRQIVAGFIIYRKTEEGIKYLFLYRRGGYWNFPKGHFERGEDSRRTAIRETEEETGIKSSELKIEPNFKTYVKFHFFHEGKKIFDTVILYLAQTHKAEISISPREHSGFAWFLYRDAIKVLGRYAGTKKALTKAHEFLHQKSHRRSQSH